jgi:hypothetical protein
MWAKIAKAANEKKKLGNGVGERMDAKLLTGRFYMERMLPETGTLFTRIQAGSDAVMSMPAEMF